MSSSFIQNLVVVNGGTAAIGAAALREWLADNPVVDRSTLAELRQLAEDLDRAGRCWRFERDQVTLLSRAAQEPETADEMTTAEAADLLDIDPSYVRRLRREGHLQGRPAAHGYMLDRTSVLALHERRLSRDGTTGQPRAGLA